MRRRQADRVTTVTAGDRQLRVAIRPGTGGGPPLLVCNGIGTPLEALAPFTSAMDPAIEVVRFDVPGVGGSPVPRLPYTIQCLARLAVQMLGELGYDRFDTLGISWGGGLAQQLALLEGFDVGEVDGREQAARRMRAAEPVAHQLVRQPVVLGAALPAHPAEHADHPHVRTSRWRAAAG